MYKFITIVLLVLINLWCCVGDDYYEILGVSRTADLKEIRRAFKKLAVIEHPDKNNDNSESHEKFIVLTKAYETLKDPVLRKKYDTYGEEGLDDSNKRQSYQSWGYSHNFDLYKDSPWVVTLDETDYYENVLLSKRVWLVNFYSPMCGHCHTLAPTWEQIAEELDGAVNVAAVNCENEWQLCHQIGIRAYPTLMHYAKNSRHGERYTGEKKYTAIMKFILNQLRIVIPEIDRPLVNLIYREGKRKKPMLIFVCGGDRHCFTSLERSKIAAIFENTIDTWICYCDQKEKCKTISQDTNIIYLSTEGSNYFKNIDQSEELISEILEYLPEPEDFDTDELLNIRKNSERDKLAASSWLLCFYIGYIDELDTILKKLPHVLSEVKLGKVNCGRESRICNSLGVNRYPMWAILKPGGAFEWHHGQSALNDIVKFFHNSHKATNVWALSADEIKSIMSGSNGNGAWFLDWYAPWCPPCLVFLKQLRKASMEFDKSAIRFGIIDCIVHATICQQHNIRSYPTAMLVNGTKVHRFSMEKTAANVVQFIKETQNPTVIELNSNNFKSHLEQRLGKFIWAIDYFAPWCAPCQRLKAEWFTVANTLSILPNVKIASVNCEVESILCGAQGIRSYPTIRLYLSDTNAVNVFASHSGQRDSTSLLTWITRFLPRNVRDLNPSIFKTEVLSDRSIWIVDFYAPWCEHCRILEPQFTIVAELLRPKAKFGSFNCEMYVRECAEAGIRAYPTVIAYDARYSGKKITNGYRINGTTAESMKNSILDFIARVRHDEL